MTEQVNHITMPKPTNPNSRWMTVDNNENLISEGITPEEAVTKAKLKTENFIIVFVPQENSTYIF